MALGVAKAMVAKLHWVLQRRRTALGFAKAFGCRIAVGVVKDAELLWGLQRQLVRDCFGGCKVDGCRVALGFAKMRRSRTASGFARAKGTELLWGVAKGAELLRYLQSQCLQGCSEIAQR